MSARRTAIQLVTKATIGFAALFLVSVLLAAMPGHHAPTVGSGAPSGGAMQRQVPVQPDHSATPKLKSRGRKKTNETAAVKNVSNTSHNPHTPDAITTRP